MKDFVKPNKTTPMLIKYCSNQTESMLSTGGPRYMREIGTPKIGSNIMNLHIKRPRITIN